MSHPCDSCGAVIDDKYRLCYDCFLRAREDEARRMRLNGKTMFEPIYTAPEAVCAPKATQTPYDARQEAISKAHEENILVMNAQITALGELTEAVTQLAYVLRGRLK